MAIETSLETEAHLWTARPGEIRDPELLLGYDALLTADERERVSRFRFEKDRHTSLVTRALVRTVLSRYAAVSPGDWRFVANEYGRPEIQEPREERSLRFNLSHTEGLVVCLVSRDREVGVDVEDRTRGGDLLDVADRFFSPFEVKALRALPHEEQMNRFFLYWTLKRVLHQGAGDGARPLSFRLLVRPRLPEERRPHPLRSEPRRRPRPLAVLGHELRPPARDRNRCRVEERSGREDRSARDRAVRLSEKALEGSLSSRSRFSIPGPNGVGSRERPPRSGRRRASR